MDIKLLGPTGAAQQMYKEGQGLESNPYAKGTKQHDQFDWEMHRLEREELKAMLGPCYV